MLTTPRGRCEYSCFTDKETEAQAIHSLTPLMSQDKAIYLGFKPGSVSPKAWVFSTAPRCPPACTVLSLHPPQQIRRCVTYWRRLENTALGRVPRGSAPVRSFPFCYDAESAGSPAPYPVSLCHLPGGPSAPISTLSRAPQNLSFLNLRQNTILQGHSPTLKGKVPRGKEMK